MLSFSFSLRVLADKTNSPPLSLTSLKYLTLLFYHTYLSKSSNFCRKKSAMHLYKIWWVMHRCQVILIAGHGNLISGK